MSSLREVETVRDARGITHEIKDAPCHAEYGSTACGRWFDWGDENPHTQYLGWRSNNVPICLWCIGGGEFGR